MKKISIGLIFSFSLLSLAEEQSEQIDPFENINRVVFNVSDDIDRYLLRPAAEIYSDYTPYIVKTGISNVFSNLSEVDTAVNQALQGKLLLSLQDTSRFLINSTVGVAGIFDIASEFGLERHDEDFGQTLGYWGVESGPYIFVPFIGPSTLRDIFAKPVSWFLSGNLSISDTEASIILNGLDVIETRERLLIAENLIIGDKYEFVKEAYLQSREYLVFDGVVEDEFLIDVELEFSQDF
tara:strand:+ start:40 stop:753 length:714 start_codon:yes stop_codon:yes gene_type:complete